MPILTLKNLTFTLGEHPLLDHVSIDIHAKEKIALIGRNGQGKSTLLKILSKTIEADSGEIIADSHIHIGRLPQIMPSPDETTVYETVDSGLSHISHLLVEYHEHLTKENHDNQWLTTLDRLQHDIEEKNGWEIQQRIDKIISALGLPVEKLLSSLSGGCCRRVALAKVLVQEPDIILLDEPTNHLDIEAIEWLEKFLQSYTKTIIFVTHDRALLKKIAASIIELDRGKLTRFTENYEDYLTRKQQLIEEEIRHNALFDKKLSDEEIWIRQGVKARRTRNEGRVRALKALRDIRASRQSIKNRPTFTTNQLTRSGKIMIEAENVYFGYDKEKPLIKDFSFTIQKGDKLAIVGPNGVGKTTLIKVLLGDIPPTSGKIKTSPVLQVAFSDQNRSLLNPKASVIDNVTEGDDFIEINGKRRHAISYLGDFLFSPKQCRTQVKNLSGGEQNRLLLAKIFTKPANLLVLDEPTNDLDIETLEVLENLLLNYAGTLIIISHDREFIDNIATHCITFTPSGDIDINVGGYTENHQRLLTAPKKETSKTKSPTKAALSDQEKQELKKLPQTIEQLESKIHEPA